VEVRLAVIGERGIANYGGFESYVAELAPRLSAHGFDVTCSCEKGRPEQPSSYKGTKLRYFPFKPPRNYTHRKMFEIIYDIYFILRCDYDIVYGLNCNAGPFYLFPRLLGKYSIVNIDGMDWVRSKYNKYEKFFFKVLYYLVEGTARRIAIDSRYMRNHVPPRFRSKLVYAPNGVNLADPPPFGNTHITVRGNTIERGEYWLVVARLEPENNIDLIIRGYWNSKSDKPLFIVGNFTSERYKERIMRLVSELGVCNRVHLLGGIYDRSLLDVVRGGCFAYIHGHSVGGTNPSLLEIMNMSRVTLAFDTGFNREVGGETVLYFKNPSQLASLVGRVEKSYSSYLYLGELARRRVSENYDWDKIIAQYDLMFGLAKLGRNQTPNNSVSGREALG
jgi:glycosyltransferase involved in cell wall biosynthesis